MIAHLFFNFKENCTFIKTIMERESIRSENAKNTLNKCIHDQLCKKHKSFKKRPNIF